MTDSNPPIDKFIFSVAAGKQQSDDLDLKISALEDRIDNIVKRVEVGGAPLLNSILMISHNPTELDTLGKALQRVAVLMPELDELKKRKSILELAVSDPGWLAATFGDFDQEIEALVIDDLNK